MKSPREFYNKLSSLGIALTINNGKLVAEGKVNGFMKEMISSVEPQLIELLNGTYESNYYESYIEEGWPEETAELLHWCWTNWLPHRPFTLQSKKIDNVKGFYLELLEQIHKGPSDPGNRYLKSLLENLKEVAIQERAGF